MHGNLLPYVTTHKFNFQIREKFMTNIILPSTLLFSSLLFCQINTETMRADNLSPGFHQEMNMSFSYISGISEIMFLRGNYRIDYQSQSDWSGFFVTKYDRAFEKSENDFSNKGFGQIRAVKQVLSRIQVESFLQKEFNYFIDLENRELIGGNVRFNPFKKFFIATGTMYEKEVYKSKEEQNFMKSTSYINYSMQPMEKVTIVNVLYYQFKLEEIDNYRILWDGKLSFQGSDWLSFYLSCNYRYDISKINPGSSYFEIINGLGFRF